MGIFNTESLSKKTDSGRMFGWWVNIEGKRVASLEYRTWDSNSQFWHIYEICELCSGFDILDFSIENWSASSTKIQSRYATSFEQSGIIVSKINNNFLSVRDLYVSEELLNHAEKSNILNM